jgi:hypothetical protein
MRALLALLLLLPMAAQAGPRILRLPGDAAMMARERHSDRQTDFQPSQKTAPPPGNITIGPFEARMIQDNTGRQHFAVSPLSGAHVLGGSIAGTYEHGTAKLVLHWPPD